MRIYVRVCFVCRKELERTKKQHSELGGVGGGGREMGDGWEGPLQSLPSYFYYLSLKHVSAKIFPSDFKNLCGFRMPGWLS